MEFEVANSQFQRQKSRSMKFEANFRATVINQLHVKHDHFQNLMTGDTVKATLVGRFRPFVLESGRSMKQSQSQKVSERL